MQQSPTNVHLRPILLIDDNPLDRESLTRALKKSSVRNPIKAFVDGERALDFLSPHDSAAAGEIALPAFVVLDLNMPGLDGIQVLTAIKENPRLKSIPVVIMTTSAQQEDVDRCYLAGANCYIQKPFEVKGLESIAELLKRLWLDCAFLPEVK